MCPVTEWMRFRVLAAAQICGLGFFRCEHDGCHIAIGMRAIAKRLFAAAPASAPCVLFAFDKFDGIWLFLGDFRLRHTGAPFSESLYSAL